MARKPDVKIYLRGAMVGRVESCLQQPSRESTTTFVNAHPARTGMESHRIVECSWGDISKSRLKGRSAAGIALVVQCPRHWKEGGGVTCVERESMLLIDS